MDWSVFKTKKTHKSKTIKDKEVHREHGRNFKETFGDTSKATKDGKEKSKNAKDGSKELSKGQ